MYVTKKDLLVLAELEAFVGGSLETVGDLEDSEESKKVTEYWQDFYTRTSDLRDKANKSFLTQQDSRKVRKQAKAILKARN